ncbi:MAG TPA: DUF4251 domain-containing protein [Puia sp.]|nr:DUF4251 domain-containing protein [Puia sp.]
MRYLLAFLPLFTVSTLASSAQSVKPLIDTQNYVFVAASVQPTGGSERRLTINSYTLKVTKNKIVSNLPYVGHSTIVPTDDVESALMFTSNKFKYAVSPGRKNGWKIAIKPKEAGYLEQINLTVTSDGYTVVNATFNGLDNISFIGQIIAPDNP